MESILAKLHRWNEYSFTERKFIEFIFKNPFVVAKLPIKELSRQSYTSVGTIFRLCQKLGYDGYTDFRIAFVSTINQNLAEPQSLCSSIKSHDDIKTVVQKVTETNASVIARVNNGIELELLRKIINKIEGAPYANFFAYGANSFTAELTMAWFMQLGKGSSFYRDMDCQIAQAMNMEAASLAVIISRTGENKRLLAVAEILYHRRIDTILLTAHTESSLAKLCEDVIYIPENRDFIDMRESSPKIETMNGA